MDCSSRPRILVAAPLDAAADAALDAASEVVRAASPDEATLRSLIGDCDALVARTNTPVSRELLRSGKRLRCVGVAGVGVERVDLEAAREFGVEVLSTPTAASDAVAEFTVALILELLRPIRRMAAEYQAGRFDAARREAHGVELRGLTIGIVGMGRIGSRVGRICAAGFGARVLYNDIVDVGPFDFAAAPADKQQIWRESDVLTLHVPLTDSTRGMLDDNVFVQLRQSAHLINTARGAVIDTQALVNALASGRIGGAALDVTDPEPLPVGHPLLASPRCIVTPHVAARTHEGLRRMCAVVDDVIAFLRAGQRA
ncbi:MAG: NAD(P)-dependent oxidoreductase [Phycisphaerae bacterium]